MCLCGGVCLPRITVVLTADNETYVRSKLRRQGDISRIINEALDKERLGSTVPAT